MICAIVHHYCCHRVQLMFEFTLEKPECTFRCNSSTIGFLRVLESYLQWILNPVAMVGVIFSLLAQWIGVSWVPESICHGFLIGGGVQLFIPSDFLSHGFWVMEVSFSKSHESNITRSEISCSSSHESYRCVLSVVFSLESPVRRICRRTDYWTVAISLLLMRRCRLTNYRRKWAKFWKRTTKIQEYIRKLYLIKAARFLSIFTTDSWSEMVSSVVLLVRRIRQNLHSRTNYPKSAWKIGLSQKLIYINIFT